MNIIQQQAQDFYSEYLPLGVVADYAQHSFFVFGYWNTTPNGAMIPVYSKERRHLSLIEMKRIMGFDDNFEFPVSRTNAIKQLANAVCPLVICSIGNDLLPYILSETPIQSLNLSRHIHKNFVSSFW
jgi:hypothetical protein